MVFEYPSFPIIWANEPPSFNSAALVKMDTVPPTEGTANLEAPKPLWIWIPEATSVKPCQLDQYTQPFSISFTGCPLIKKDVFLWSKPLKLIRESPYPPPCLVAYTPGVRFMISGNSRLPTFKEISTGEIVDTATGVSRTLATSITPEVTTTSPSSLNDIVKRMTTPFEAATTADS